MDATFLNLIWPWIWRCFYPLQELYRDREIVHAAAILVGISLLAWRLRKDSPCVLTGWLWFLGMLVPVIGLVQVGDQAMADRYMYLPAVGLFVAIVFGIDETQPRWRFPVVITRVAALLILLTCVVVTEYQLQFWRNTETLFSRALSVTKNNGPAHMMLGVWLERKGGWMKRIAGAYQC